MDSALALSLSVKANLAAGITATADTLTIESGHGDDFPGGNFQVYIQGEIIAVESRDGDTFSGLTRGQAATEAAPHNESDQVHLVLAGDRVDSSLDAVLPSDLGLLGWNYSPGAYGGATSAVMATLVPWLFRVPIPQTISIGEVDVYVVNAGITLVAGSNIAAVYDSSGVRRGASASQHGIWNAAGVKQVALVADPGQSLKVEGGEDEFVWVCLLTSGATVATFARWSQTTSAWVNGRLPASQARVGKLAAVVSGGGPPLSFNPATDITLADTIHWVGLA